MNQPFRPPQIQAKHHVQIQQHTASVINAVRCTNFGFAPLLEEGFVEVNSRSKMRRGGEQHAKEADAAGVVRALRGRRGLGELVVAVWRVRGQATGVLRVHSCGACDGAGAARVAGVRGVPQGVLRELPCAHLRPGWPGRAVVLAASVRLLRVSYYYD